MHKTETAEMSADAWDELNDPRPGICEFDEIVDAALTRRGFVQGVLAFGSCASIAGVMPQRVQATQITRFEFDPIPVHTDGTVHVPDGYKWERLVSWGDPLFSDAPVFDHATGGDEASADRVFGENTDGMEMFAIEGRHVLAINNEFASRNVNLPHAPSNGAPTSLEDVRKLQKLQGVSVLEVAQTDRGWDVVKDSRFNRRITHLSPMRFAGPAAGHDLLKTQADPSGRRSLGTINNCGSGKTPWGTYLTCEENFNGYFGTRDPIAAYPPTVQEGYSRYGIRACDWGYHYYKWDDRFDTSLNQNEPHRFGWVVEIDPANPESIPVKHTGLGRLKHENAEVVLAPDGRVVVYMGDDERGEFLYRFVSHEKYVPGRATDGLLDEGTLFAAKFHEDGTGEWRELTPETTGMADLAEIAIFTRQAGSAVGATTMDRPEWIAANLHDFEVYCCLTNNKSRGVRPNAGGDPTPVNGPNPREANRYGQIVRWRPSNRDHAAPSFDWDLYVMAGNPDVHEDAYGGSNNVTSGNMFNSPDGISFDTAGFLWIRTDGDDSNEGDFAGMGNNQMLVGDPITGAIARFLTAPKGSEVTGLAWSSDRRAMFVGIQHPDPPFPDGDGKLPRSSVIVVTREDGAALG